MSLENWKNQLQNWCQLNGIDLPVYTNFRDCQKWWHSMVTVNGIKYEGERNMKKVLADMSAARKALDALEQSDEKEPETKDAAHATPTELKAIIDRISAGFFPQQERKVSRIGVGSIVRRFENNLCNEEFIDHLRHIVRGKKIDITNTRSYQNPDVSITLHIIDRPDNKILSTLSNTGIKIEVPSLGQNMLNYQVNIWLTAMMELGAEMVSVIDPNLEIRVPSRHAI